MNTSPRSPDVAAGNRRSDVDQALPPIVEHPEDVRGLGTGAIAAPMAVSFREEKLALQADSFHSKEQRSLIAGKDRE